MKKILIIITTAFVEYGGLTTVVMNYFRFMDKEGLQIDIASTNTPPQKLVDEVTAAGGKYHCLGKRSSLIAYRKRMQEIMQNGRYDILHVHSNSATAALELQMGKKAGIPVRIVHNHNSSCKHKILNFLMKPVFYSSYTDAVACSAKAGAWLFPKDGFLILNNAIDTEKYAFSENARRERREALGLQEDPVIVHVGKINQQKNHAFLLAVFAELLKKCPNAHLVCVGDGVLKEQIVEQAQQIGIDDHITITGMVKNVHEYLSMGDYFVFPSLWEGLPLSLLEAQANGLRCVVSDNITTEANVTDKVRYLSLNLSVTEWADCILASGDRERARESDENIQRIVENGYSIQKNASRLRELYLKKREQ